MTIATIKLADNYATIQEVEPESHYIVQWAWLGHEDAIRVHHKRDAYHEWRTKANAIIELVNVKWN